MILIIRNELTYSHKSWAKYQILNVLPDQMPVFCVQDETFLFRTAVAKSHSVITDLVERNNTTREHFLFQYLFTV